MPLRFPSVIMNHSQRSCFSVQATPTSASLNQRVSSCGRSQRCLASWVSIERKGAAWARSTVAAKDVMNQPSPFPSSPHRPPPSRWRAAPCSSGRGMEGGLDSAVTACGGRNPPGSGHRKHLLETWSQVDKEEQEEDSLAAGVTFLWHLSVYLVQQGLPPLELQGTDG